MKVIAGENQKKSYEGIRKTLNFCQRHTHETKHNTSNIIFKCSIDCPCSICILPVDHNIPCLVLIIGFCNCHVFENSPSIPLVLKLSLTVISSGDP